MKRGIAFFDFDGTITTRDTLLEFIKYSKGTLPFYWGFLLNSPFLVAYKLKIISNQAAKEKVLGYFFRNTTIADFNDTCSRFVNEALPGLIRPGALAEIEKHKQQGVKVVIVSASPENWLVKWTNKLGLDLIATRLQNNNGRINGKIDGKNCHGEEKVRRIQEVFVLSQYDDVFAYGDSGGDKPMLGLANHAHYKPFRS
jgi:phosphatidylglycerophosphatase C